MDDILIVVRIFKNRLFPSGQNAKHLKVPALSHMGVCLLICLFFFFTIVNWVSLSFDR